MMKISKPILTNDFMLGPFQFTSLNSILFKNVKNVYDGSEKLILEYEHSSKIEVSSRDWIGIFPRGWSTLQQYVTFEWVSQSLPSQNNEQNKENGEITRRTINFTPKFHLNSISNNSFYQFVYVTKQIEILGVSSYFRFDLSRVNSNLELECLKPVSSKIRSASVSDFGALIPNNVTSTTSLDARTLQTSSIHSLQNMDTDGKSWSKHTIPLNIPEVKKPSILTRKATNPGDLDPYSSHSEPVFPMTFPLNHCKKCFHFKRSGEFLRSQQVLQSKVGPRIQETSEFNGQKRTLRPEDSSSAKLKIVMERNKVLEERTQEMKKEMERLQAESKKLKMSFYNTNKKKVAYEQFVKDFIKSLEKDSIVRVVNGSTEILVKKVNYVGMEEHPRDKKTSKRERELKAVIGLQEITIRNLINSLQEKAKSDQELNQTVKLAQAFSAAREDSREFGSDTEENDEISNSDVASEYEFSLSKPQPPDEVAVEDTDAVLDDIRRATENELKDIGISRSLGKCSSRDSDLPNLSVRSYQNQSEGTQPKKPRLFDNVEDCWPHSENPAKTVHRKVIESCPILDEDCSNKESESMPDEETNELVAEESSPVNSYQVNNESDTKKSETDGELSTFENFYDACEAFNTLMPKEPNSIMENPEQLEMTSEEEIESKKENNFLVTAIIPQNLNLKPTRKLDESSTCVERKEEVVVERKTEVPVEKGKKFTCELSIDFAAKVRKSQETTEIPPAIENESVEESKSEVCLSKKVELYPTDCQTQREKFLTLQKANKRVEIKITQKESPNANFVHQKMVVEFEKDVQVPAETNKTSKFEFNLAVSGLGENTKIISADESQCENKIKCSEKLPEIKMTDEESVEMDASPRTEWNDAAEDMMEEDTAEMEDSREEIVLPKTIEEVEEKEKLLQEKEEKFSETLLQDSLRYEKNLEFLQQKTEEREKIKEEEEISKEKPSAILIQNGQTKLALIRY